MDKLFHRASSGREGCGGKLSGSGNAQAFQYSKEDSGSDILLLRQLSVPVKVTAVAVSDGDGFTCLKMLLLRGNKNWAKVG